MNQLQHVVTRENVNTLAVSDELYRIRDHTYLHYAVCNNSPIDVIRWLCEEMAADVTGDCVYGAAYHKREDVLAYLISRGGPVTYKQPFTLLTALEYAAFYGWPTIISILLRGKECPVQEALDGIYEVPRLCKGQLDAATLLIEAGARAVTDNAPVWARNIQKMTDRKRVNCVNTVAAFLWAARKRGAPPDLLRCMVVPQLLRTWTHDEWYF